MPKSYSLFNRRKNIFQPNFLRQRQVYNGPISSEKLNLFNDQFVVDVARLVKNSDEISEKIEEINQLYENNLDSATPGYYIDSSLSMTIYSTEIYFDENTSNYVVQSATPHYLDELTYYKPAIISSKISLLKNKLDEIEKKLLG